MADSDALANLRDQIDAVDTQLSVLLDQRAKLARAVAKAKKGGPVYRPAREAQVIEHVKACSDGSMPPDSLETIYREIIAACRNVQLPLLVSYLGPQGAYTEEAAIRQFGQSGTVYLPAETIDEAIQMAEAGDCQIAVVPVENSTEGAVTRTLDILLHTKLRVVGEISLPIRHQLLTHAPSLTEITEVAGHPQALAQCRKWLDKHLPGAARIPMPSNAEAARSIYGVQRNTRAAIAGVRAAALYNLPVLAKNIQDSGHNTTRFLALGTEAATPTGADKTSIACSVPNKAGTLHELLAIFARAGINMSRLESRPSPSGLWDYVFFIDIDGHEADEAVAQALQELHEQALFVTVLGSYPKEKVK